MTTAITLMVPEDRASCVSWLSRQPPNTLADILDCLQNLCGTVSSPDIERVQRDHTNALAVLRREHSEEIALLKATTGAEKNVYEKQLKEMLHEEVQRQMASHLSKLSTPSITKDDLSKIILVYYADKKRLPRICHINSMSHFLQFLHGLHST